MLITLLIPPSHPLPDCGAGACYDCCGIFYVFRTGRPYKLGWQAGPHPTPIEENTRTPKSNRMPDAPHRVKVVAEIVDGIQDLRQNFIGSIKMTQVGARVPPAHSA